MVRVTLFNAAPDTGNLGVSALGQSVISGLARRIPGLSLTVADKGRGIRPETLAVDGRPFGYQRCGMRSSRHLYRPEALWNIRMAGRFGGAWNPIARHLLQQDFILDITGGDSFTDLYGQQRFQSCTRDKALCLDWGIPLGFLPQTYGPFQDPKNLEIASSLVQRAQFAWARDERSYEALRGLVGDRFDPDRHQCGVDVAFLLEAVSPPETPGLHDAFPDRLRPTVGLNISGLIYNDLQAARQQYSFIADYRQVIAELIGRLLKESDANILLVPHVVVPPQHTESDTAACQDVWRSFATQSCGRVAVLPELKDPREVKWVISQCDWFCGTRMHATIAALSTGVPTAAIAYSLKTAGVFETCGQGEHVADPRKLSTSETVERLWRSWSLRRDARHSLTNRLPQVLDHAERQMDQIAAACQGNSVQALSGAISG